MPPVGLESSEEQVPFEDPTVSRDSKELDEDLQGHNEAPSGGTDIVKTEDSMIGDNIDNSNNIVVSEVSESVSSTDKKTEDTESSVMVKSEPECSIDQESIEHTGEIPPEASVKTEDVGETVKKEESEESQTLEIKTEQTVEIKTEPVDVEFETEQKDSVESNAETVQVKEEEENASDNESFADAKDELENETDKQEDRDPVT